MHKRAGSRRCPRGVLCVLCALVASLSCGVAAARGADEAAWLFDPGSVVEIDLGGLTSEEMAALEAEPSTYQKGTFELKVGGVDKGPPLAEVGIRLVDASSLRGFDRKPPFEVKFDEYTSQTFFGLQRLTLDNMATDPSMLRGSLARTLFRAMGVPASRSGYADVSVNGTDYGVYLDLETFDGAFLASGFGSTRHLYGVGAAGVDVAPGKAGEFEVNAGDAGDTADLEALIAAANAATEDWAAGMEAVANLAEMARTWAVERYIGSLDGYAGPAEGLPPSGYFLHDEDAGPNAGRFVMLPWDADAGWETHLEFAEPAAGLMFNRCLADADCKALYVLALQEVQEILPSLDLGAQATARATTLAPWQGAEADPRREFTLAQIEAGVEGVHAFLASRPAELAAWLEPAASEDKGGSGAQRESQGGGSAPAAAAAPAKLRIDSALNPKRVLRSSLHLPGAGNVSQVVTIATAKGRLRVCAAHARVSQPGTLTLRCRLTPQVRRRLRHRHLKLLVVTRFAPVGGKPETVKRHVRVPRLGR